VVEADSAGYGLRGVVSQVGYDGLLRPIGFHSHKLNHAEINYEIHDKELLAIVATVKDLYGELRSCKNKFTILSHYYNFQYYMTPRRLCERQIR
jgi:hypothetical protein